MHNYNDLKFWQKAHQVVLKIYSLTNNFPGEEKYGLTSQLRRASVSTAANIVEGSKRKSNKDFAHFLNIAEGSASEVEYLLLVAKDVGYLSKEDSEIVSSLNAEVCRMLYAFRTTIQTQE